MSDYSRLIEHDFPLKQASLDSVHEKNVRHGHISTLHIWPARRPLAACRAALLATLLPDPGTPEARQVLRERIGGQLQIRREQKKMPSGEIVERAREETTGGVLHWGLETENGAELARFRAEIRQAFGGRAPRVLDPFAGGGAIPLEAMRLGCEATAIDLNPVAWFILKCTLEYPQALAGQRLPLPSFILNDEAFMEAYHEAFPSAASGQRKRSKARAAGITELPGISDQEPLVDLPAADLGWQVRAWGTWILERARRELAEFYPTYADFEPLPLTPKEQRDGLVPHSYEHRARQLVPLDPQGRPEVVKLNADFDADYLKDKRNPRWVAKPTVAYLWARTVTCKNCRAEVPLLKTRWLCKKDKKRILLTMEPKPDRTGVVFGVRTEVPVEGQNAAQRREADRRVAAGTMTRTGVTCPCCKAIMTMEDLRLEGQADRLGAVNTVVVVDGSKDKEYRPPLAGEMDCTQHAADAVKPLFDSLPYGMPTEPLPSKDTLGFRAPLYGFKTWGAIFTSRQLIALGIFAKWTRAAREEIRSQQYSTAWVEAISAFLMSTFDRMLDFNSSLLSWITSVEAIRNTFGRFALPMTWDYSEAAPINAVRGGWAMCLEACIESLGTISKASAQPVPTPQVRQASAIALAEEGQYDLVVTDPPYYDAIPYSDLMDFFYLWLRRTGVGLSPAFDQAFQAPLSPKWDQERRDGELIDESSRHGGDAAKSKQAYEDGMAQVFVNCHRALTPAGRLVIVFAHKKPDAWETLVAAIIRAGFVVDGSWPIQTEQAARMRAQSSAALASSVWLVCRKRSSEAKPGWDNKVLAEMRSNIYTQLREFWDAGIRGPDFVWAATGPALEAYSQYPAVRKADVPDAVMKVGEFLSEVRRIVVDFVVGRVLDPEGISSGEAADRLDQPTAYYILHRHDFQLGDAPAGACILYALSCGLSDRELATTWDLVSFTGGSAPEDDDEDEASDDLDSADQDEGSGFVRLKAWDRRRRASLGLDTDPSHPVPLIDRVHKLMQLWKAGELAEVEDYIDAQALRKQELFRRFIQALIELAPLASEERSILESLSNHLSARGSITGRAGELALD